MGANYPARVHVTRSSINTFVNFLDVVIVRHPAPPADTPLRRTLVCGSCRWLWLAARAERTAVPL